MRRSTIAVCLLLLSPTSVSACIDELPVQGEWFYKEPSSRSDYNPLAESMERDDTTMVVSVIAGGVGVAILPGLSFRAAWRSRTRGALVAPEGARPVPLALPFDRPDGLTIRIDQGHDESSPARTHSCRLEQTAPLQTAEA
jgi:hypothetical protein